MVVDGYDNSQDIPIVKRWHVPHYARNDVNIDENLIVNTQWGTIHGMYDSRMRSRMFRGVPYATPPVDELRWSNARQPTAWSGVRDGTKQPPGCIQQCEEPPLACPTVQSEDCLYLDVYTPAVMPEKPMPVIVFIHGGNFRDGFCGSPLYDGSFMSNSSDTVVVTINYRLGVLGWLASENNDIRGNFGLTDQRMALVWIQQNIAAFGGDPMQVTLTGQSAGAISTAVHMYAPGSAGLFQQALIVSEPYGIPLRRPKDMYEAEVALAGFVGCASGNVTCYNEHDSASILDAQVKLYADIKVDAKFLQAFMPMTPLVDGHQIPVGPIEAFQKGMVRPMPMIQGNTRQEGFLFVYEGFNKSITTNSFHLTILAVFGTPHFLPILDEYPVPGWEANDTRPLMSTMTTDAVFICCNRNTSLLRYDQDDNSYPNWYYVFDHPASFASRVFNVEPCWNRSCHGSDLPFIFHAADGIEFNGTFWNMTEAEYKLSEQMTMYWTNFAHTSDPNVWSGRGWLGQNRKPDVYWPKYDPVNELSVRFTTPSFVVDKQYLNSKCNFWDTQGYTWEN